MRKFVVLVVDDDAASAHLTVEALRDARMPPETHVVVDGEQALQFLHREGAYRDAPRPDLILLDLNMPKTSGQEVLSQIKREDDLADIPVVILTVSSNPEDVRNAYRNHAAGFITKSADKDQFFTAIRMLKELWLHVMTLPRHACPSE